MANKNIFKSTRSVNVPVADTRNLAGGAAYKMSSKHALAQLASTGCFNDTYYATAEDQLKQVQALCNEVPAEFIAKVAIYARERGYMKDMPAFLVAKLSSLRSDLFAKVLPRVVDNPKMLRNVVQMIRSGSVGRKSLGTRPKRVVQEKLASWNAYQLFRGSVGNSPSLGDVIKMVHPRPENDEKKALYGWLTGAMTKDEWDRYSRDDKQKKHWYDPAQLPNIVKAFEQFKKNPTELPPDVPFEMLTALPLTEGQWKQIAINASWTQTRMNLNTFERHGVFKDQAMVRMIADRLRDEKLIQKAKVFPYQLMVAYLNVDDKVPQPIKNALQDAMEIATKNVPELDCNIVVCPDVSGSMQSAVTGHRKGATSKVRCIDVAALVAASLLRKNKNSEIIPFEGSVHKIPLNPYDSIMTNAAKLANIRGGSTNCSAPLVDLNRRKAKVDLVVYISDNESWVDGARYGSGTATMEQFELLRQRNPKAKMICIDINANTTTQAKSRKDILNVGGFSDQVFDVIHTFFTDGVDGEVWTKKIEAIEL